MFYTYDEYYLGGECLDGKNMQPQPLWKESFKTSHSIPYPNPPFGKGQIASLNFSDLKYSAPAIYKAEEEVPIVLGAKVIRVPINSP